MDALVPESVFDTSLLVYGAMASYALGFVFRRQVVLRLLVLLGSTLYVAYYFFHPEDGPLWDAILASVVIASATLFGLCRLLFDGVPSLVRPRDRAMFEAFEDVMPGALTPGQFRRLMRAATVETVGERRRLLELGRVPLRLFFVQVGEVEFYKGGRMATVEGPRFVGDVAFVTGGIACDDAWLRPGARVISWSTRSLRRQLTREPALERALHALLSRDMAAKIARSVELPRERVPANESVPIDLDTVERLPVRPVGLPLRPTPKALAHAV